MLLSDVLYPLEHAAEAVRQKTQAPNRRQTIFQLSLAYIAINGDSRIEPSVFVEYTKTLSHDLIAIYLLYSIGKLLAH